LIGAPSPKAAELMAQALAGLEPDRAFVVHGSDGLDEVTTTGPTMVFEVTPNQVHRLTWTPADFGVAQASAADLQGGDRALNLEIALAVLEGKPGAPRDIVLVNAAAALVAAGLAENLAQAMQRTAESIDSGAARNKLDRLADFTNRV